MQTLAEVTQMLTALEQKEGREAVHAWVIANAKDLPEEVRDEVLFRYSTDAFIAENAHLGELNQIIEEATASLENLQADKRDVEAEIKKIDVEERLGQNS